MNSSSVLSSEPDYTLTPVKNGAFTNGHVKGSAYSDSSDDEEMPLSQATPVASSRASRKRKKPVVADSSSEDEAPLASSPAKQSATAAVRMPGAVKVTKTSLPTANGTKKTNGRTVKQESGSSDEEGLKEKLKTTKQPPKKRVKKESDAASDVKPKKTPSAGKRKVVKKEEDESDASMSVDEEPPKKKSAVKKEKPSKAAKEEAEPEQKDAKKGKGRKKKEEVEEEEIFKWWELDPDGDGSQKWKTLVHSGVIFPPPYEPLPKSVKMLYDGRPVDLPPEAEEVAGFYAALLETDHAKDNVFITNFFNDWQEVLKKHPPAGGVKITKFASCDFRPMFEHFEAEKAKKKALTAAEKKAAKKIKDDLEASYATCLLDGRKEKVGNFRVEPPGLFKGRGEHPKKGSLKLRVRPEDITINIGEDAPTPQPNMPGKWKNIIHDNTVTWLATWVENINGNHKYVFLAASSSLKGQSDMSKFEKARELKKHVDRIRKDYRADLRNKVTADRMRATAMYFIDKLALRAGNEKGEDEADTVGCCSLRCEHVTLEHPNFLIFDFLGKDSIRYYNRVEVEQQIFKNIVIFKKGKEDEDTLFDRVTTAGLNKHLNSYMPGLTAKVFRTFNASSTFQRLLDEQHLEGKTLQEKLNAYNAANRDVAILCNHQRSIPKTHDQSMEKMRNKIRGMKYDRMKLRHALFATDSKFKKNKKYSAMESDIDDDFVVTWEESQETLQIEKAEKKFAKENEKLAEEGKEAQEESVLKERIADIKSEFKRLAKERGTGQAQLKRDRPAEKLEEAISKIDERIKTAKLQMVDRDEGKQVALGTSKINYLDPRITVSWCKKNDVPVEKMFNKSLINKFPWAMAAEGDWQF